MHLSPAPLHIPDGFLNLTVSLFSWAITMIVLSVALRRGGREFAERQIPLMGVMAAFIFAAQMINFPGFGGTSGHLLGGALAAITLGPWGGIIVMASVVALQALLFQDGGLLVMGANILNMGIVTVLIGFGLYRLVAGRGKRLRLGVAGGAAWLGVMAAALLTSVQLWLSGTAPARVVFPAMLGVHALIGIGEGLITMAALSFVNRIRPALLDQKTTVEHGGYGWVVGGLVISLGVLLLSPLASTDPDGLERVAADLGFLQAGQPAFYKILPDYIIPALGETGGSTVLAGTIGMVVVAGLTYLIGRKLQGSHLRVRE
jgi:cobalt/nickel transport system permease protein